MLSWDDERWNGLEGGYRTPFDPRPLLKKIESGTDLKTTWHELWGELHHQGDVGEASYAAIPHLLRIHRNGMPGWYLYAMVATIELARDNERNSKVPEWLEKDYFAAIHELAEIGIKEFAKVSSPEVIRTVLALLAIDKGFRTYGRMLLDYSEEELLEFESSCRL
jgi:hypothetical protein